jgi:hypothetical protein
MCRSGGAGGVTCDEAAGSGGWVDVQAQAPVQVVAGQMRRVPVLRLEAKLLRGRVWWVRT